MSDSLKTLLHHFQIRSFPAMAAVSLAGFLPLAAGLIVPVLTQDASWSGMAMVILGFALSGQALALGGRVLDRRFLKQTKEAGGLGRLWAQAWAEGLVVALILAVLFTLVFDNLPYYWSLGGAFGWFGLATLALGTTLFLGALPYYLPVRRREGLGVFRSLGRCFRLMNAHPGLSLGGAALGLLGLIVSVATFGLFPGLGGLAALHQGLYDQAVSSE